MTKNGDRHASIESSDSWRSSDTVRAAFRSRPPVGLKTDSYLSEMEPQISPGTVPPAPPPKDTLPRSRKHQQANWDASHVNSLRDYRKQLAVLDTSGARIPSISRNPPTATSPAHSGSYFPANANGSAMPASWFNDSNDDLAEFSPGCRRGSGQEDPAMTYAGDHRRPSVVSTVSSSGSKSSRGGYHKPLQNFFGEEFPGDSRQNSDPSLVPPYGIDPQFPARGVRNRTNSLNNNVNVSSSRPASPNMSRPRTPLPLSDVTPWEFQGRHSKEAPTTRDERASTDRPPGKSGKTHKLRLPGHRHHNSKDDKPAETPSARPEISHPIPLRPLISREDSAYTLRRDQYPASLNSAVNSRTSLANARPPSPTPSAISELSKDTGAQRSPSTHKHRNLTQRFFGKLKAVPTSESLQHLPGSSISLQPSLRSAIKHPRQEPSPAAKKGAMDSYHREKTFTSSNKDGKREHKLPFKHSKRHQFHDTPRGKTSHEAHMDNGPQESLWTLDTDLNHMEGILHQPPMTPPIADVITAQAPSDPDKITEVKEPEGFQWDAPDSWAVKRFGDEVRHGDFDESAAMPGDEEDTRTYCVRVFRTDSTFATLNLPLNVTALDIINIMGKKTMLQDDLSNYHIVMRKHDTWRQLEPQERPVLIQKRLLEQAGYSDADRLEEVGREDNSYLCRFTFIPAKMVGYASLEKDPGLSKMQKFSHIDLQGKNLFTIPITLYQKATEIISLNLSRNLSLDVPKDFIQACTNLREIKYTSNDARRLPPSLGLASRLTMLDISNNRLENLEKAELHNLHSLQGLRLSNNRLTSLPAYFGKYRALRSLNLSSNSLSEFPDFLCDVRTLVDLDISFNSISSVPKIGQLTCLERLWATNNKLSGSFPSSLSNLINLKEIDVRFNFLDNMDVMAQLPNLESLMIGHNSISAFEGAFQKLRVLRMDHNPVTRFGISAPCPSLVSLNLASAKLAQLPEDLFPKISGLTSLVLDKNHFTTICSNIGKLYRLEHLSVARNSLDEIPSDIGRLVELRYLDVRENNLGRLPAEIWYARRLETLNVSSNVLDGFPKPSNAPPPPANGDVSGYDGGVHTPATTPGLGPSPSYEELGKLEDFQNRRPSQASSGYLGSSTIVPGQRKGSMASYGTASTSTARNLSVASRTTNDTTISPVSRKDSTLATRLNTTFAGSLRHIFLADNRLSDDVFDELALLPELRIVNLAHNLIIDIPSRTIRRWHSLTELYLSGNDLTSLPTEDLGDISSLKVLHINSNKFQVLPAELGKVSKLAVLDVASNSLKYNVANWPYDWNWNWNPNLKYLNLSGNKRLEIKPSQGFSGERGAAAREEKTNLTEFTSLEKLRILGLMDVTMMVPSVPEQTEDRRIRTTGSTVGSMPYGIADSLGRNEHVSTLDLVIPRFRSVDEEQVLGLFDGQPLSSGGSRIAKYLYDNLKNRFVEELNRLRGTETPVDALRRTYLGLNKELLTAATQYLDKSLITPATGHRNLMPDLTEDDLHSGCVATVLYIKETDLYVSNVGDAEALLIRSEGGHKILTQKHDPAERNERTRIREAGGFVSRNGKLNDVLEVSRAFGYVQMSPSVIASPFIQHVSLGDTDEMILIASRELWEYLTPDFAVDVARSERTDLSRAAQKLRDLAIAFGATNKIMVVLLGVSDLKNAKSKRRLDARRPSASLGPSGSPDEFFSARRIGKRGRNLPNDSKLARLDNEVDAPTGEVSLVFTDIKNSTLLWETYPIAMRSAIKMHNELMRRQLRIIGGYEVKTEGDAFMVAFPTVTSALLWCFTIQSQLLEVPWPQEILNSINGQEVIDQDGNVIFRGLSVRMGIHYGRPVCEVDPVTKRMDYFGPMVNRASRISSVADGGQITVSADFIAEIQRLLETHEEGDRSNSAGDEDGMFDSFMTQAIQQELRSLSSQGFEVKDLGERRLKGLENPEYIYLMYPHSLASRLAVQRQMETKPMLPTGEPGSENRRSELTIDTQNVWDLWNVSLRLEMLCSTLENPEAAELKPPETALLERMKTRSGDITDRFLLNFVEHQISRIETCTTTLALRHMVRPIGAQAGPMADILNDLQAQLKELRELKSAAADSVQNTPFVTPAPTPA